MAKRLEQGLRGQSLSDLPAIEVLESRALSGETLARAVERVVADGPRGQQDFGFDGAIQSVHIAKRLLEQRT